MRRIFYLICTAALAASCFSDDPMNSRSYNLNANFEFPDAVFMTDSVQVDKTYGEGIGFHDLAFFHKLTPDKSALVGGFAVSRLKGSGYALGRNDFRVNSGAGYGGSQTYAVFKSSEPNMPAHDVKFMNLQYGSCTMIGCYLNNTAEVVDSVKANFAVGDRLTVRATGYLNGLKTGQAELTLADYSTQKDSIVVNWTPFDLSKLGAVEYVDFEIISTSDDIPASFCMDNMISYISLAY